MGRIRKTQRLLEGSIGSFLIRKAEAAEVKKSGMLYKSFVDSNGRELSYMEKPASKDTPEAPKTLILLYGLSQRMEEMAAIVNEFKLPANYRILVPEIRGHGTDINNVLMEQKIKNASFPSPTDIVDALGDFLVHMKVSSRVPCYLMGYSMGGAAAYHLKVRYPELIEKVVLVAPAIEYVVNDEFLSDFKRGTKSHFGFQDRQSLKIFFRDLCPPERSKKDPVPKFLLQGIVRLREERMPLNFYHDYLTYLNTMRGTEAEFAVTSNEMPLDGKYLVLWPKEDFCCRHDKGLEFFTNNDNNTSKFVTIENSGHTFLSDGEPLLFHCMQKIKAFLL